MLKKLQRPIFLYHGGAKKSTMDTRGFFLNKKNSRIHSIV